MDEKQIIEQVLKTLKPFALKNRAHYKEWQYINYVYYTRYRDGDAKSFFARLDTLFHSIQGKEEVEQPLILHGQQQTIAQSAAKRPSDPVLAGETGPPNKRTNRGEMAIKIHYMKGKKDTGLYGFVLPSEAFNNLVEFLLVDRFHFVDKNQDGCFKRTFGLPSTNSFLLDKRYMDDKFKDFYKDLGLNTHNIRFDVLGGKVILSTHSIPDTIINILENDTKYNPILDIDYPRTDFFLFKGQQESIDAFFLYIQELFGDSTIILHEIEMLYIIRMNEDDHKNMANDDDMKRFRVGNRKNEISMKRGDVTSMTNALKKKSPHRFVILDFRIAVENENGESHANFLIFDRKAQTYGRYDPNGRSWAYDYNRLDNSLIQFMKRFTSEFTYDEDYFKGLYCPENYLFNLITRGELSFQHFETKSTKYARVKGDVFGEERLIEASGFCQAWVFYVLYLTLSQGDKPVVERSFFRDHDNLADIIRSWASKCYNMTNKKFNLENDPDSFFSYNQNTFHSRQDMVRSVKKKNSPYPQSYVNSFIDSISPF